MMSGTSQSAAVVAGMAAVVREYFMSGVYPSGAKASKDAFVNVSAGGHMCFR